MPKPSRPSRQWSSRRASAIVAIIIALVVLQIAVMGAVLSGGRDTDLTVRRADNLRAFYAAEGAMNMAIREYALQSDESGDGTIGSIANFSLSVASASVTVTSNPTTGGLTLDATATSAQSTRNIRAGVKRVVVGAVTVTVLSDWLETP